ncbi:MULTISPECIES: response regulator [Leeuwenhoekiella]|mgnify:FL=1|uniref:DNA-binding response regulator, LuxR family protein n=1 Tax=Leeuwenhoekiella blandensis (strain CECT 7118 / CCUG 51940 / KCTC 22103 / MED217) TaxID=398720 RepID=A3XI64_LEEBM|nr:response regulator transcription factor [Leeuwenhoekiella blandensis]EAQ51029.1 DNA-binding response regulator, LuxR family protein [Leeuwenhoekiella blandensis MED217]|tara:strand:- start:66 stop:704 length:639 start_codon:yes stop_codon:yes gene_type:complete
MITITVADHHPIIVDGLTHILKDTPHEIIDVVSDGKDLIPSLEEQVPDLVIMEIDMPNLQGLSAIKELRKLFPGIKIMVFSTHPEGMYALSAIKAGAMGYIGKIAETQTVHKAVVQVARGGIYLNNNLVEMLSNTDSAQNNSLAYRYKKLSTRETEVLNMLSSGKRNKDIAESLDINEKTVSTYKTRLLKKLDAGSLAELIQQARLLQTSDL